MTYLYPERELELYSDGHSMTGDAVWEVVTSHYYDRDIGGIDGEAVDYVELLEFRTGGLVHTRSAIIEFLGQAHMDRIEALKAEEAQDQLAAGDFAEAA